MGAGQTGLTATETDFLKKWASRFPHVVGLWVYGSRVTLGIEQAGDLDVLFILSGEPERSWLRELKTACTEFQEQFGVCLDPLVISLATLWHKLMQGDVQLLTIMAEGAALHDPGLLVSLRDLALTGTIKPNPGQLTALLDFAEKNLAMAEDTRRIPVRRLVLLRTAARSALQALCLRDGMLPPPPRTFPDLASDRWLEELGTDVVADYREFERVISAASKQRSTTVDVVAHWTPRIARLVACCTAVCTQRDAIQVSN